jgi:hypothetical protein
MLEYQKPTDQEHKITLPSKITLATWDKQSVLIGDKVSYEVRTLFVGNGSDIKFNIKDKSGKTIEKVKGKVFGNLFMGFLVVPDKAKDELSYEAELPKHKLKLKSDTVKVFPAVEVTNMKWSEKEARRGDVVKMTADVKGVQDETEVEIVIFEYDADGAHDPIAKFPTKVKQKKVEAEWEYEYHDDTDDIPTDKEMKKYSKSYNPPEYYFVIDIYKKRFGGEQESKLLEFKDWIEINLSEKDGNPVADEDYELTYADEGKKKGKLDKQGNAKVEDISPGKVTVEFPNLAIINPVKEKKLVVSQNQAKPKEKEPENKEGGASGAINAYLVVDKPVDKLFGSIGTALLHFYQGIKLEEIWWANKEEKKEKEGWYNFNIAHFLSSMVSDDFDWMILANIKTPDPKLYGDRSMKMFKLLRKFRKENKNKTVSFENIYDINTKKIKENTLEEVKISKEKKELTFFTTATTLNSPGDIPSEECDKPYFPEDIKKGVKNYLEEEKEKKEKKKKEKKKGGQPVGIPEAPPPKSNGIPEAPPLMPMGESDVPVAPPLMPMGESDVPVAPPLMPMGESDAPVPPPPMSMGIPDADEPSKTESIAFKNVSSRCSHGQINAIVKEMQELQREGELDWPVFSVWDCNCFHTSGYLMGKYAFDCADSLQNKTLIVVNIDQHSDAGRESQKFVSSDKWGVPLIKQYEKYGKGVYVSLSSAGKKEDDIAVESHVWYMDKEKGIQYIKVEKPIGQKEKALAALIQAKEKKATTESWILKKHLDDLGAGKNKDAENAMTKHWQALLEIIGSKHKHFDYVFLSIDRDCMKKNFTQWGDNKSILENYNHVNEVADAVLSTLIVDKKKTKLVGFDVTGLPEGNMEYFGKGEYNPCFTRPEAGDPKEIEPEENDLKSVISFRFLIGFAKQRYRGRNACYL